MAKQQVRLSEVQATGVSSRLVWHSAVAWGICLLLILAAWFFLDYNAGQRFWGDLLLLCLIQALVALATERALASTSLRRDWVYRLAFICAAGVLVVHWLGMLVFQLSPPPLSWLLFGLLGSFLGGLLASGLNESFWENNSPPSESVSWEVHQHHLDVIGVPGRTRFDKRLFDVSLSLFGLVVSFPVWLVGGFLVWLEDPGPILFVKNSVGKGGLNFHQFKFRSMLRGAEEVTGPILAGEKDDRVLIAGRFLRKTALDELPQLVNILRGEMSFVGPRPQRTVLVHQYLDTLPQYAERHRVVPGLAGLAQVAGDYYLTPRQKLRFDRLYIQHISLGFDLKLFLLAFSIAFWFRWQPGWNGRLPRKLVRLGSRPRKAG
jgi:lipopolysaccharide/colanic/teichoic acid biosynthesis glycosyltransferase